jgi:hypothetical protein
MKLRLMILMMMLMSIARRTAGPVRACSALWIPDAKSEYEGRHHRKKDMDSDDDIPLPASLTLKDAAAGAPFGGDWDNDENKQQTLYFCATRRTGCRIIDVPLGVLLSLPRLNMIRDKKTTEGGVS